MSNVLYRYHDSQGVVTLQTFRVLKHTPKGMWIFASLYDLRKRRFVLSTARKRFAYPTEEEAKVSFLARKRHQLEHLQRQIENVETAVKAMKEGRLNDRRDTPYFEFDA